MNLGDNEDPTGVNGGNADLFVDKLDVYTINGSAGDVYVAVHGEQIILHTASEDDGMIYVDELFARTSPGRPTVLDREQAQAVASHILDALAIQRPPR
jgi:hypothetical protein